MPPKSALIENEITIKSVRCYYRWVFSYGDYYCFIKEYDDKGNFKPYFEDILHFGQRNSDFRKIYYFLKSFNKDKAELIRILASNLYGQKNWSNNDRRRNGLSFINLKRLMNEREKS